MAVAVRGKVGIPLTGLTTPVGWLSLPQLTVLSRSAKVVQSVVFGGVVVLSCCVLDKSVGVRAYVIRLSQISSFFSYCHDKYATLADVIKHCVENLTNHVLRYRKLLMDDKSGMMKYQTGSHDGIISFILNGRGKGVHVQNDKVFVCDTDSKRKKG